MRPLLFLVLLLPQIFLYAQKKPATQAEFEKQVKELKKQAEQTLNDPRVKKAMQDQGISMPLDASEAGENPLPALPAKNTKALAALPSRAPGPDSLHSFINRLNIKLQSTLSSETNGEVQILVGAAQENPLYISRSAVAAWYKNSPEDALALATQAALKSQEPEVLNTLAALLHLCGHPERAIPILLHLNDSLPGNSTVQNNLGQAYLALGDREKGENYLLQCIAISPRHTEANKSLGLLYAAMGKTEAAKNCILRSLEGGFSQTALDAAQALHIDEDQIDDAVLYLLESGKAPAYFDPYKYQLPPLCERISDAPEVAGRLKAFQDFLRVKSDQFSDEARAEGLKTQQQMQALMARVQSGSAVQVVHSPLFQRGVRKYARALRDFAQYTQEVSFPAFVKMLQRKDSLDREYQRRHAEINASGGADHCARFDALSNEFLPLYAMNLRNFIDMDLAMYRGYIDELAFWSRFVNTAGEGKAMFYGAVKSYLSHLKDIADAYTVRFPSCDPPPAAQKDSISTTTEKPDCPIDISLNLVVAELEVNCEEFSISANAGLSFKASKKFGGETTLAVGIGAGPSKEVKIPGVKIEGSLHVSEQFYIVFDRDNHFSDLGLKMKVSDKVELKGGLGPVGKEIPIENGFEFGYTLGLNTGWNFTGEVQGQKLKL